MNALNISVILKKVEEYLMSFHIPFSMFFTMFLSQCVYPYVINVIHLLMYLETNAYY
jgi:hypothetical protein